MCVNAIVWEWWVNYQLETRQYVIPNKITRFRQDIQMSAIIKIIALFVKVWENGEIRAPWPLSLCGIVPTKEVLIK